MKALFYWLVTLGVLAVLNGMIFQKQAVVDRGTTMLLKLAPVDPRSLIQGDYMALRYEITRQMPDSENTGTIVVQREENGVTKFIRVHHGEPLGSNEHLLKFRRRDNDVRLGAEAFFFQEGDAERFQKAKFGELKVAPDGSSVLIGLRDESLQALGKVPAAK